MISLKSKEVSGISEPIIIRGLKQNNLKNISSTLFMKDNLLYIKQSYIFFSTLFLDLQLIISLTKSFSSSFNNDEYFLKFENL